MSVNVNFENLQKSIASDLADFKEIPISDADKNKPANEKALSYYNIDSKALGRIIVELPKPWIEIYVQHPLNIGNQDGLNILAGVVLQRYMEKSENLDIILLAIGMASLYAPYIAEGYRVNKINKTKPQKKADTDEAQ